MLVILAIAAIAILACVVLVSLGKGGELTEFPPDVPPLDLPEPGQLTAVDFMALQLPVNLVGYHTASVDETLRRAANAISARDTRIAVLEQRVSELLSSRLHARQEVYAAPGGGLRTDHSPEAPAAARELPESGDPVSASGTAVSWDGGVTQAHAPEGAEWRLPASNGAATSSEESSAGDDAADRSSVGEAAADRPDDVDEKPDEAADEAGAGDAAGASDDPEGEATGAAEEPVRATLGKDRDERP
ncbi:hypothetical protein [Nonomuraea polychroma]|uniref:hypothetical protein n=1 Tax=Nonomuraea polychroma TaxID=46176 RepID=UPI000FDCEC62|nr:hypothetical protein [Nonomuraea polychroma]